MRQGLLFSIILSTIFCAPAFGYDWSTNPGDGSEANPYQISTPEQLNSIGGNYALMNKCFRLTADIDMSSYTGTRYNIIGGFEAFSGVFDGDGYVISNLTINQPDRALVGLFARLYHAEINNVGLKNIRINGRNYVGGLAGASDYSVIRGCYTTGTVGAFSDTNGQFLYCGGLIGQNNGPYGGDLINCYSNCDVSSNGKGVGGLIGSQWSGQIFHCHATGNISGDSYVGGLVGVHSTIASMDSMGIVEECFATGNITGDNRLGGLVGEIGSAIIKNSYSTGSVTGKSVTGGLTGCVYLYPYNGYGDSYVEKSFSTGKVIGSSQTGGLVGRHWNQSQKVYGSFWDTQTSGWTYSSGGIGKTTAQMQMQSTFSSAGWDFNNIWYMAGSAYPILRWELSPLQPIIDAAQDGDVIIVEPGVYEGRLYMNGKNITLTSLDPTDPNVVANTVLKGRGLGAVVTFKGTENETCLLDGFTITGGFTGARGGGISGNGTQAGIYHCTIENNSAAYGGGIDQCHGRIENCIIRNNSASVNGAGLAVCGGDITNCLVYENTAGNYGGGFHYCNGAITNCTVSENTAVTNGRGLNNCNGVIANSIIWGKSIQEVFNCPGTTYCCYPGASGIGNIDTDPLFVDVAGDDYHLLPSSTCINAGDPSYVPEPDETDLAGISRRIGSAVDMGCYEFPNAAPVADAGEDQVFYASLDGTALVQLDGTGSTDADGDALEYFWYNDANELIATGAEPNVLFGVGQYEITLIVNDGTEDSLPNSCVVTVVDPFEALEAAVTEWVQDAGIANSLLAKVDAAQKILEDGNANNDSAAAGSLWAFINAVNAQRGKKISEEVADSLITAAEHIIDML